MNRTAQNNKRDFAKNTLPPKSETLFGGIFMARKVKYTYAFKLRCVEEVLIKHQSVIPTANKNDVAYSNLKEWVSRYIKFGKEGLLPRCCDRKFLWHVKIRTILSYEI